MRTAHHCQHLERGQRVECPVILAKVKAWNSSSNNHRPRHGSNRSRRCMTLSKHPRQFWPSLNHQPISLPKESLAVQAAFGQPCPHTEALTQAMANQDILTILEQRIGRRHARQRLGIEKDHEAQVFGQGINFFHIENWPLSHVLIRALLMATGLYWRGISNAAKVDIRHNPFSRRSCRKLSTGSPSFSSATFMSR